MGRACSTAACMHARWQVLDKNGDEGHRKNNKRINQGRWKGSVPKAQRAGRGICAE